MVASLLLPRRLRQPFYDIYAFCRTADDMADGSPSPDVATRRLRSLGDDLGRVFDGDPPGGIFVALADTVRRYELSRAPFDALLDAFLQDQRVTRYASEDELLDYCRRSANPVGQMILGLAGCHDAESRQLSDEICTGLQLANFWQDVRRDFEMGRIYVPASAMARHGVDESTFGERPTPPAFRELIREACEGAEDRFRRGLPLAGRVPRWLATDVKLFAYGGLATLDAIRAIDFDVLSTRPTVGRWRRASLLARALFGRL